MITKSSKAGASIVPVLLILAFAAVIGVAVAVQFGFLFDNDFTVVSVGVTAYTDAGQSTEVTLLSWGDLAPGDVVVRYLYVNSTSTVPVTLNLTTADWTPLIAADYVTLTWNLEGATIQPLELLEATLTLSVDPGITGVAAGSFTTTITAEAP